MSDTENESAKTRIDPELANYNRLLRLLMAMEEAERYRALDWLNQRLYQKPALHCETSASGSGAGVGV